MNSNENLDKAKSALECAHSFPVRDAKDMALMAIANALVAIAEQGVESTLECIEDKSRWAQMFGTPERAARTLARMCAIGDGSCVGCPMFKANLEHCKSDYTHLKSIVEWLRGDAE